MYAFQIDHVVYDRHKDDQPITLVAALAAVRGVGCGRVLRADGTLVVDRAGSDAGPLEHAPSGRTVRRRMTRWARAAWLAEMTTRSESRP